MADQFERRLRRFERAALSKMRDSLKQGTAAQELLCYKERAASRKLQSFHTKGKLYGKNET